MQKFFDRPLDTIHCFYTIVGYWSVPSDVIEQEETGEFTVLDRSRNVSSVPFKVELKH